MTNPFANAWVQLLGYPLMLTLVGMYTRRLGRRDGDDSPRRNDWALGTTLLFMTLGVVVSDIRAAAPGTDVQPGMGWLLGVLVLLFVSLDFDREYSWKRDERGRTTGTKAFLLGIVLPDATALGIYCFYQSGKG